MTTSKTFLAVLAAILISGTTALPGVPSKQNEVYYTASNMEDSYLYPQQSGVDVGVGSGSGLVDVGVRSPHSNVNVNVGSGVGVNVHSPKSKVDVGVGTGSGSGLVDVGYRSPYSNLDVNVGSGVGVNYQSAKSKVDVGVGSFPSVVGVGSFPSLVGVNVQSPRSKVNVDVGGSSGVGVNVQSPKGRVNVGVLKPDKAVGVDVDTVEAYYPNTSSGTGVSVGAYPPLVDVKVAQPPLRRTPVDLKIHIPNIFSLNLDNQQNGERRLGILAPFFRFDLSRPFGRR